MRLKIGIDRQDVINWVQDNVLFNRIDAERTANILLKEGIIYITETGAYYTGDEEELKSKSASANIKHIRKSSHRVRVRVDKITNSDYSKAAEAAYDMTKEDDDDALS